MLNVAFLGYSIPTIRHAMAQYNLPEPVFINTTGEFKVVLYHKLNHSVDTIPHKKVNAIKDEKQLLIFCRTPRTRAEIISYLNIDSAQYALRRYLDPLLKIGAIRMTVPEKPRSHSQKYFTADDI